LIFQKTGDDEMKKLKEIFKEYAFKALMMIIFMLVLPSTIKDTQINELYTYTNTYGLMSVYVLVADMVVPIIISVSFGYVIRLFVSIIWEVAKFTAELIT
jgi:hypothetical protein